MNILVVGGGAREHAICNAVVESKNTVLYSIMHNRNPGIERLAEEYMVEKETNINSVTEFACDKNIDLALVGPEAPLQEGLTDALMEKGITTCAPTKKAARIETDKEWM
ncbi:MAG TPA: phosphoribosylamine--glycine ligase, partial [Thermoplasmatales archaeon]|nr:phosphoribosylamine--glycine ligase [Thermoplasmatales archaeon]